MRLSSEHSAKLKEGRRRVREARIKEGLSAVAPRLSVRGVKLARVYLTPTGLLRWRLMLGVSQPTAALLLGIGHDAYKSYEAGSRPMPKVIELACAAYALGLRYYEGPHD